MARGWESKSVEQQQDEAATTSARPKARLTPEQAALKRQRQTLELSRDDIRRQLTLACNPRHRQMLDAALADLEVKLRNLNDQSM
jgi:hypothetical protein